MMVENLGWFLLGGGMTILLTVAVYGVERLIAYRRRKRFHGFISQIKSVGEELIRDEVNRQKIECGQSRGREISELNFRDPQGKQRSVKIIVDHALKGEITPEYQALVKEELKEVEGDLFIFSPEAIRDMRANGLEVDEVVAKMLKASGRMA